MKNLLPFGIKPHVLLDLKVTRAFMCAKTIPKYDNALRVSMLIHKP